MEHIYTATLTLVLAYPALAFMVRWLVVQPRQQRKGGKP